jgi:hypothetical protein
VMWVLHKVLGFREWILHVPIDLTIEISICKLHITLIPIQIEGVNAIEKRLLILKSRRVL